MARGKIDIDLQISDNGYHEALLIGDRIIDNYNQNGVTPLTFFTNLDTFPPGTTLAMIDALRKAKAPVPIENALTIDLDPRSKVPAH